MDKNIQRFLSIWVVLFLLNLPAMKCEEGNEKLQAERELKTPLPNSENRTAEELPTPEAFFWNSLSSKREPVVPRGAYHLLQVPEVRRRPVPRYERKGYYALNDKGEYVYASPEQYLRQFQNYPASERESYADRYRKERTRYAGPFEGSRNPVYVQHYPQEYRASFLDRIINTGSGLLKLLNPLTYLQAGEPYPPVQHAPRAHRETYPENQYYEYIRNGKQPISYNGQTKLVISDFEPEVTEDDRLMRGHNYYEDEVYDKNVYDSQQYTDHDLDYVKEEEPQSYYANDYNQYVDYEDVRQENPKVAKTNPSPPASYDPRQTDRTPTYLEEYRNIYGVSDLDNVENFDKIDNPYTIEYLKQNKLRDDIYIGKDGNLYLEGSGMRDDDFKGLQMYGMSRPELLRSSRRKRIPPYQTINRNKETKGKETSYHFFDVFFPSKESEDKEKKTSESKRKGQTGYYPGNHFFNANLDTVVKL